MDNALKVQTEGGQIELYMHRIYEIADTYVDALDEPEDMKDAAVFSGLITEIYIQLFKPSESNRLQYEQATYQHVRQNSILPYDDIETLDKLFDLYCLLCAKYKQTPTLLEYGRMTGVSKETFHDWISGNTRNGKSDTHRRTAKRWKSVCECSLEKRAYQSNSIGAIFGLKASYGWRETSPVPVESTQDTPYDSLEEIAARHAKTEKPELPNLDDFD